MSNSYTSPPTLVDPARVTASQTLRTTELSRLGDLQNYCFGVGGCGDVINQSWDSGVLRVDTTSLSDVCEWYVPRPSNLHNTFKFRVAAHRSVVNNSVGVKITFPLSGNTYSAIQAVSDSSRFQSSFEELTVNITGSENELFCRVALQVDVLTSPVGYVEIALVEGRWSPLSTPLATGSLSQGSDSFIPQGVSRLGADLPLSARFGVNTINNITTLRKRGRTLFQWSGAFTSMSGINPPQGLGVFDPQVMYSTVALFGGMNQISDLDVDIFINVENYVSGTFLVDIFGHRLSIAQNGWNSFGVTLRAQELQESNEFRLSMYRVGLEPTVNNEDILLSQSNQITSSPVYIKGLSIIGV